MLNCGFLDVGTWWDESANIATANLLANHSDLTASLLLESELFMHYRLSSSLF